MLKNILILVAGIIVLIALFSLAWFVAGFLIRLILAIVIVLVIVGLIVWAVRQIRGR